MVEQVLVLGAYTPSSTQCMHIGFGTPKVGSIKNFVVVERISGYCIQQVPLV